MQKLTTSGAITCRSGDPLKMPQKQKTSTVHGFILSLVILAFSAVPRPGLATSAPHSEILLSEYIGLAIDTYPKIVDDDVNSAKTIGGGAFIIKNGMLVLASRTGRIHQLNLHGKIVKANYLPSIDLGAQAFKKSTHINYHESLPRLHDITFANDTYYATYDKYNEKIDRIQFELAELKTKTSKWVPLYTSPPIDARYYTLGNGGKMALAPGYIYFSVGDNSLDRKNNLPSDFAAQNPTLPWGKINRINLKSGAFEVYSIGHRNPQGLLATADGSLIASEHGPRGGDELNIIKQSSNYGWPSQSFGTQYDSMIRFGKADAEKQFAIPLYAFIPSIAPTQLIELKGFDINWEGDLLLASLKAQSLYRIKRLADKVLYVEQLMIGKRIRDIKQHGKKIFLLTDDGSFMSITSLGARNLNTQFLTKFPILERCTQCHSFEKSNSLSNAPSLQNIYGRKIGVDNYNNYSTGFRNRQSDIWNEQSLYSFIRDPGSFISGTSMPRLSLTERQAKDVVDALKAIQNTHY